LTPDRLAILDRLLRLHDDLLATLSAGRAPDLDAFGADCEAAFAELRETPAPESPAPEERARLEALAERNAAALRALGALRDESSRRLVAIEQGRRGLRGYQSALTGGRRRNGRFGQG
jgi:hypothetical protein